MSISDLQDFILNALPGGSSFEQSTQAASKILNNPGTQKALQVTTKEHPELMQKLAQVQKAAQDVGTSGYTKGVNSVTDSVNNFLENHPVGQAIAAAIPGGPKMAKMIVDSASGVANLPSEITGTGQQLGSDIDTGAINQPGNVLKNYGNVANTLGNAAIAGNVADISASGVKAGNDALNSLLRGKGINPEAGGININELGTGETGVRDMRYKQGNPEFKKGEAGSPVYATDTNAPQTEIDTAAGNNTPPIEKEQFGGNQKVVTQQEPTTAPAMPQGPGRTITRIDLGPSVYGAGNEAQVQNTVDHYVPGETAGEQYRNLQPTIDNFGKQINAIISNDPKNISVSDITKAYDENLANSGIYRTSASSKGQLQEAAQGYIRDLTGLSDKENQISDKSLYDSLQKINQDSKSVFKKIDNGTSLTEKDQVILAARKTVRDTLTGLHSDSALDGLMKKQGDLYDATESLYDARGQEIKQADKLAGQSTQNPIASFLKGSVSSIPRLAVTAAVAGGLGLGGFTVAADMSIPKKYKFSSGDVSLPGFSNITDSTGAPLENPVNITNQINAVNEQEKQYQAAATLGIPSAVTAISNLEKNKASLTNRLNAVQPIYSQYEKTSNVIQGLDQAQKLIKSANPQWFQAYGSLGGKLTDIRARIDPNYASFTQQLNNLQQQYGVDTSVILDSGSREAADAAINQTVKSYTNQLQNTVKSNGGVWPGEAPKTGGDILKTMIQQTGSGSDTLNKLLTPTPQPTAAPTPDAFQQMLKSGVNYNYNQ